jgi:hypothetical protein
MLRKGERTQRRRRQLLLDDGGLPTWEQLQAQLAPLVWLKLNESSGDPINHGSLAGLTISQANCTQAQAGVIGAADAYSFNGSTSRIQINTDGTLDDLAPFEIVYICKPASAGESNVGHFWRWGATSNTRAGYQSSGSQVFFFVDYGTTDAQKVIAAPAFGDWQAYFFSHDNANTPNARIFLGDAGVVTEPTPTSNVNQAGSIVAGTSNLFLGNNTASTNTFDGLIDEILIYNRVLTTEERTLITQVAGV